MTRRAITQPAPADPVQRRAEELDALEAILPFDRRDQLAALLTDDDVATLKHLAKEGTGANNINRKPNRSARHDRRRVANRPARQARRVID